MKKMILLFSLILFVTPILFAQTTYYSRATGNWNDANTWSTVDYNSNTNTSSFPEVGDIAYIGGGFTVTVNVNSTCASLSFNSLSTSNTTVAVNSGITLAVSGAITIPRAVNAINTLDIGAGTVTAASVSFTNGGSSVYHRITITTGTLTVSGDVTQSGSTGSATISISGGGALNLGGTFLNSSNGNFSGPSSTVTYNKSGAQTIGDFTYYNLTLSGSGVKTFPATTTEVDGTLSLEGSATTSVSGTLAYGGSATLQYKGSAAQTTGSEFLANSVPNLTIYNTYGVTLSGNKNISGTFSLISGKLITTSSNLLTLSSTATISGGTTSSYVDGPLQEFLPSGGNSLTFPIGKGSDYRPVTFGSLSGSLVITAEVFDGSTGGTFGSGLDKLSTVHYWYFSHTGFTSGTVNLSYYLTNGTDDGVQDNSNLRIAQSSTLGGTYSNVGGIGSANGDGNITSNSVSSLGYFTLANATGGTNPLPVELTSFTASVSNGIINLKWGTATEVNNYGFDVERSVDSKTWTKVGFVAGAGNSSSPKNYSFKDQPDGGSSFSYRLKQIDVGGAYKYSDPITVSLTGGDKAQLMQNSPNPFNPSTAIKYYVPQAVDVTITIYDILGREVTKLVNSQVEAGYHIVYWNGRDRFGNSAASGIYIYRLKAGNFNEIKKMNLLK